MKRAVPILLATTAVVIGGLLVVPAVMDWNKYKPEIIAQAKQKAGYEIAVGGDIGLAILPAPKLKIENLSVAAPRGEAANLLTMKQADVSVKLLPLLGGRVVVDTVRLVDPVIALEKLRDGSNSWMSDKLLEDAEATAGTSSSASKQKSDDAFSLDRMTIDNGQLTYVDRQSGSIYKIASLDAALSADSLKGPFAADGQLNLDGRDIGFKIETERMTRGKTDLPVEIELSLPAQDAKLAFKGIVATDPMMVQGKLTASAENLAAVLGSAHPGGVLSQKASIDTLITANPSLVQTQELEIQFGNTKGTGSIAMANLEDRNPAKLTADMTFAGQVDLDKFVSERKRPDAASVEEKVAKGQTLASGTSFLPATVSLPFPIDGTVRISAEEIKTGGVTYKGLVTELTKAGQAINVTANGVDFPGKTSVDAKASIRFATSSSNGESGITYKDPSAAFTVNATSEQLPSLLRAYSSGSADAPAFELYKTGRFQLAGDIAGERVSLKDSVVKLDNSTFGLAGSYKKRGVSGRPDVSVDLTSDVVDVDAVLTRLSGQKRQVVQASESKQPASLEAKLAPARQFDLPMNLIFDISAQKAIYQQQPITGVRIRGRAAGSSLSLENASVQDFAGASASLKGSVADMKTLDGVDLSFYGKTANVKSVLQTFEVDTTKLPAGISAAEAKLQAKGNADAMNFDADVAALDGHLTASGNASSLLSAPQFSNLSLGASHPNLARAIQIVNPSFAGGEGLEQPFSFETRAVASGKSYDLTAMKARIGESSFNGDLKIDLSREKPSLAGTIDAGTIALDKLLGADTERQPATGGTGSRSSASPDGKWSRAPVETGWMQAANVDLALSAQSIMYGGWNFSKPTTKITLRDGTLLVDNLKSGLFGGTAQLTAKIVDPADIRQPLSLAIQSRMEKVDVEPLSDALSGSGRLKASGDVSLDFNVQSSGLSPHAIVSGLQGKANLSGANLVMRGFDLAQIGLAFVDSGKPLDRLNSLASGTAQGGQTRFDTVNGAYDISQGMVNIVSMALDGPSSNITSRGSINLPQWSIDTMHTITFKQARDAGAFDVAIKGPLDNPGNTFGRGIFNDVLTRRLQQKAVEKLPDVLGKDLTGKLQGLGILPPAQQPVPAPAPAPSAIPDATAPADAPVTDTASPAPQEPQPPAQTEQQDPAAEALKGVLEGFLR